MNLNEANLNMNNEFFPSMLTASASFSAILLAAMAVFLTLYETNRTRLSDRVLRRYRNGLLTGTIAFVLNVTTVGLALAGLLGLDSVYIAVVVIFSISLALVFLTGMLIYRASR